MNSLRIAVAQLECHPAIVASHYNYLTEPFVPGIDRSSLSLLSTKGLDVGSLEALCRTQYLQWHQARISAVLAFLGALTPAPDLVAFPEASLPLEVLQSVAQWSAATGASIFAGSHTPRRSPSSAARYDELGVPKESQNRLFKYGSTNTLPIIRNGEVTLIPKRLLSPFEKSIVSAPSGDLPAVRPLAMTTANVRILPLICSEALQINAISETYDMVGIISYDSRPQQFRPYIEHQVAAGKPVFFCNDGAAGNSFVHTVVDRRVPNWLIDAAPDGLPPGDAILVVDVNLDVTAVQVGTAVPKVALRLISLSSVTAEYSSEGEIATALRSIGKLSEPAARAFELDRLLARQPANALQRLRIARLRQIETEGISSEDWWTALGAECIIPSRPNLRRLEATLAATCSRELASKIASSPLAQSGDTPGLLVSYLAECGRRSGLSDSSPSTLAVAADRPTAILDRDGETGEVHRFLDDPSLVVLELSGLEQIGKSAVLAKALAESGVRSVLQIPLSETSSADYILYSILSEGAGAPPPPYSDAISLTTSPSMVQTLKGIQVIVFERAHLLLNYGAWRDDLIPRVLESLVSTAGQTGCKMIFETRRQLRLTLVNPFVRKSLRVYGLERSRSAFGVSLFDAQLRRVGLSPAILGSSDKALIVNRLGGHPVAIALAADTVYERGSDGLVEALRRHQGFFLNFVGRLVRKLELSEQDATLLRLLSLARAAVPREALLKSVDFSAGEAIRELISMGAAEVTASGLLEIPGVLREYFEPEVLTQERRQVFHTAAAEAYAALVQRDPDNVAAAVEAEYHAGVAGVAVPKSPATRLVDGALASAFRHYRSGDYEKAAGIVGSLLQGRRTVDILRLAAEIEAHRNNFDGALRYAREAFARDPKDTQLLADLAKIALNQYRDDIAESMISMARAVGMEAVSILIVEGRMWLRRANLKAAETAFLRAVELTTKNPWPFYYLGVTYMEGGRLEDAVSTLYDGENFSYESRSRSKAALMAIRTKLGITYLLMGRIDLGGPIIERLVEEDPENAEVLRAHGALIIARDGVQQTSKALELLTRAHVRTKRDRAQLHLFTGVFYLAIGNRSAAADEFRRGMDADSGNVLIMMKLARTLFDLAYLAWRNSEEAFRAYLDECAATTRTILRYDRDNEEGLALMSELARVFNMSI